MYWLLQGVFAREYILLGSIFSVFFLDQIEQIYDTNLAAVLCMAFQNEILTVQEHAFLRVDEDQK